MCFVGQKGLAKGGVLWKHLSYYAHGRGLFRMAYDLSPLSQSVVRATLSPNEGVDAVKRLLDEGAECSRAQPDELY